MASCSVSSQGTQKYDVFLNFRGEDVRFGFVSYLIKALNHASLNIFVDYNLKRGENIESALLDAIQDSKVALTIFSEGYASSPWTLDELVKIMECRENPTLNQKVIPVFYHVDPSHVRDQGGVFAQDFAKHTRNKSRRRVRKWRKAMEAAGGLSGRRVEKTSPEVDVTLGIVNDVLEILGRKPLEISSRKLKDCSYSHQQQGNDSTWTIYGADGVDMLPKSASKSVIYEVVDSQGHKGYQKFIPRIAKHFHWTDMKKDFQEFVKSSGVFRHKV